MLRQAIGLPRRIAVPVGPRPRSLSAQVIFKVSKYPSSKPANATGRTLFAVVVLGETDPDHLVAAIFDDDPAHGIDKVRLLDSAGDRLAAVAERLERAVEPLEFGFLFLRVGDVLRRSESAEQYRPANRTPVRPARGPTARCR